MTEFADRVRVATSTTGQATNIDIGAKVSAINLSPTEAGMVVGKSYAIVVEESTNFQIARATYVTSPSERFEITEMIVSQIGGTVERGSSATKMNLTGAATVRVVHMAEDMIAKSDAIAFAIAL